MSTEKVTTRQAFVELIVYSYNIWTLCTSRKFDCGERRPSMHSRTLGTDTAQPRQV